jgi:hypothetical protein
MEVESGGPACLPAVLKLAVQLTTPQGNDRLGPADCPHSAGPFEAGADDGCASGLQQAASVRIFSIELAGRETGVV